MHNETDVGDYPEQVLAVLGVQFHGLVIVGRQQNLGTRTLPELELLLVQGLFQKLRTLLEHQFVERGQIGGIIPYRVLHQQYGLHSGGKDVGIGVHPVLKQLDYGEDKVGVAVPGKDIVDGRAVGGLNLLEQFL